MRGWQNCTKAMWACWWWSIPWLPVHQPEARGYEKQRSRTVDALQSFQMSTHQMKAILLATLSSFLLPGISHMDWSNAVPYDKCLISSLPWHCPEAVAAANFASSPNLSSYWGCCCHPNYIHDVLWDVWCMVFCYRLGVCYGDEQRGQKNIKELKKQKWNGSWIRQNLPWALKNGGGRSRQILKHRESKGEFPATE